MPESIPAGPPAQPEPTTTQHPTPFPRPQGPTSFRSPPMQRPQALPISYSQQCPPPPGASSQTCHVPHSLSPGLDPSVPEDPLKVHPAVSLYLLINQFRESIPSAKASASSAVRETYVGCSRPGRLPGRGGLGLSFTGRLVVCRCIGQMGRWRQR